MAVLAGIFTFFIRAIWTTTCWLLIAPQSIFKETLSKFIKIEQEELTATTVLVTAFPTSAIASASATDLTWRGTSFDLTSKTGRDLPWTSFQWFNLICRYSWSAMLSYDTFRGRTNSSLNTIFREVTDSIDQDWRFELDSFSASISETSIRASFFP